ncbi:MAG: hypothetical protein COV72_04555 [Candidatus Omnitrophica bacterium CG11_big_fil_rev_8_21_14_0_20_42_13]|uniref:Uncharacterized protein n=1 Tax=Candidatus Ghiorseimicrobium undicola TaxID=1974746 RepID=A0A2H0LXR7_9BACT|nr:MAG: hypothetical protein COV72_04555 [Candidatus Omnitrophica bacterium CG11_big_fil_rev_8_21_14_0_20_42_13]
MPYLNLLNELRCRRGESLYYFLNYFRRALLYAMALNLSNSKINSKSRAVWYNLENLGVLSTFRKELICAK